MVQNQCKTVRYASVCPYCLHHDIMPMGIRAHQWRLSFQSFLISFLTGLKVAFTSAFNAFLSSLDHSPFRLAAWRSRNCAVSKAEAFATEHLMHFVSSLMSSSADIIVLMNSVAYCFCSSRSRSGTWLGP